MALYFSTVPIPDPQDPALLAATETRTAKALFGEEVLLTLSLCLVKLSVLLFYGRVFSSVGWFKVVLWLMGAVVWAYFIGTEAETIFFLHPDPQDLRS